MGIPDLHILTRGSSSRDKSRYTFCLPITSSSSSTTPRKLLQFRNLHQIRNSSRMSSLLRIRKLPNVLMTQSRGMAAENVNFPKPEPHTFFTQKKHPVHNAINFVKFSSLGATIVYAGHLLFLKIKGDSE